MRLSIIYVIMIISNTIWGQQIITDELISQKNTIYLYWGWNQSSYSKSDISFTGVDYDFILSDVIATDRQSTFSFDQYFNPTKVTIPQYNFRIGYFLSDHLDISFGNDHMKYVVRQNQIVNISGVINRENDTAYNGTYQNEEIFLQSDFLEYEHTDGLNYLNVGLRHTDQLLDIGKLKLNGIEGIESGILFPRTNTMLLRMERRDEFLVSGYGASAMVGLSVLYNEHFFMQGEVKGGYINLPNVRTTQQESDMAKQSFWFAQWNVVFGSRISI